MEMTNIYKVKRGDNDVIIGCNVKYSSGVTIFYFKYNKKLNFNFILN
jgi:hypothetical protein